MKKRVLQMLLLLIAAMGIGSDVPGADPEMVGLARDNNAFAIELYSKLRNEEQGDIFFSPYSISSALAMTYAGARGETAVQMADALHFPRDQDRLHSAFRKLNEGLHGDKKTDGFELSVANALWGQRGKPFLKPFVELAKSDYEAAIEELDFAADPEGSRKRINKWVEDRTHDKIKDLLARGVITGDTKLVLTNAIYFKGQWETEFKKSHTEDRPFFLADGKTADVPMMHQMGDFRYAEDEDTQMVELPYRGGRLSMTVLLPKQKDGLEDLEKSLSIEKIEGWSQKLGQCEVDLGLPKFTTTTGFSLVRVLQSLGMIEAFTKAADFSGMDGAQDLKISDVIHKAFVDVNEEGTEAAAATAVVMVTKEAAPMPPVVFRADHPFLFMIRDRESGSILFMGRITDPR